jgi:hypothetical protein
MSPQNKYDGFFSKKDISGMEAFKPTPTQITEALMALAGTMPDFYKDTGQRMVVTNGIAYLTDWLVDEKEAGRVPDFHVGYAAFMMMLVQVMDMTYDDYAGDYERKHFPRYRSDEEEEEELF